MNGRYAYFIALILTAGNESSAQSQSLTDVFPLTTGFNWTYQYQYSFSSYNNYGEGFSQRDSGTIIYYLLNSAQLGDSVSWSLRTTWNLLVHCRANQSDTAFVDIDTAYFTLWESTSGNHRLFVDDIYYYANPIWKFMHQFPDSQAIYRYQRPDSSGRCSMNTRALGFFPTVELPLTLTFSKDTGLISIYGLTYAFAGEHSLLSVDCKLLSKSLTSARSPNVDAKHIVDFSLHQNFPNPFNSSTVISYQLPSQMRIALTVFDLLGRRLTTPVDAIQSAGHHTIVFDGTRLSSGVYLYRLSGGGRAITKSFVLLK